MKDLLDKLLFLDVGDAHFGLSKNATSGIWHWADGSEWSDRIGDWSPRPPANNSSGHNCAQYFNKDDLGVEWSDVSCSTQLNALCQWSLPRK